MNIERIMASLEAKHPGECEYLQAVKEVLLSIEDIYNQHPEFEKAKIIERLVEPDRIFTFRVTWVDDRGEVQTNLGYRVQFNNAIGPYKGGIRFHASVNLSILKFLGFEQTFKNALTTLPSTVRRAIAMFPHVSLTPVIPPILTSLLWCIAAESSTNLWLRTIVRSLPKFPCLRLLHS